MGFLASHRSPAVIPACPTPTSIFYNHSRSLQNLNLIMSPAASLEPLWMKIEILNRPRRPCINRLTPTCNFVLPWHVLCPLCLEHSPTHFHSF